MSVGIALRLIATPAGERDLALSERAREGVLAAVAETGGGDGDGLAAHALALQAALRERPELLGSAETALMAQWLERIAAA